MFLDCPPGMGLHCPNVTATQAVREAIGQGIIYWHALPFNAQPEMFDAHLLEAAVQLTHDLDDAFSLDRKVTVSQRDVPGITRSAIPILAGQGVKAVSVGVNGGSAPPGVPKNAPFLWRDTPSNTQLIGMWHPGGYSGQPVDQASECVTVPGFRHALCMAWRQDNAGPHSLSEVENIFNITGAGFPGATVKASTFDAFVSELLEASDTVQLPVVAEEIGDTWIYGVASDAGKVKEYRAALRLREQLLPTYQGDASFKNFSRLLMKVPEHTWGLDIKHALADFTNWSNKQLQEKLAEGDERYERTIAQWRRQRGYIAWALEALQQLPGLPASPEALWRSHLGSFQGVHQPGHDGLQQADSAHAAVHDSYGWVIEEADRRVSRLQFRYPDESLGQNWISSSGLFARAQYSTYTERDYNVIWDNYSYASDATWFAQDFGKPNCSLAQPRRADNSAYGFSTSWWQSNGDYHWREQAAFPAWAVYEAGAPAEVLTSLDGHAGSTQLLLNVTWSQKSATRLPEALWLRFAPGSDVVDSSTWQMYKLGRPISPSEVVFNGSQSMHAVTQEGVSVLSADHSERLYIRSLDAALVSPGWPTAFPTVTEKPDMTQGMSFNLANNLWGTNYIMWQPYNAADAVLQFRFVLEVERTGYARRSRVGNARNPVAIAQAVKVREGVATEVA